MSAMVAMVPFSGGSLHVIQRPLLVPRGKLGRGYKRALVAVQCRSACDKIRISVNITEGLRKLIREVLEEELDDEIEEMRKMPEYKSLEAFTHSKFDNDDFEYSFMELHALARNMTQEKLGKVAKNKNNAVAEASREALDEVKFELNGLGFNFIGRQPPKEVRGFTSPLNGKNRFAGTGGGGSGFGTDWAGPTGRGHGHGPGAIGGEYDWDPNDPKNLGMGAMGNRKKKLLLRVHAAGYIRSFECLLVVGFRNRRVLFCVVNVYDFTTRIVEEFKSVVISVPR